MASESFVEISHCVAGPGVNLDLGVDSLYDGCTCLGLCEYGNQAVTCRCTCAYDENGLLSSAYLEQISTPLMECNSRCSCDPECQNRKSQSGLCQHLSINKTKNKGYGVTTDVDFPVGSFIGEYVGEVISNSLTEARLKSLGSARECYIIQFHEHFPSNNTITTNIDASYKGNITRFINHSCDPNLTVVPVRSNSIVPRLCFFTCKNVSAGEELCFSYFGKKRESVPLGSKPCACDSNVCIGYLPLDT